MDPPPSPELLTEEPVANIAEILTKAVEEKVMEIRDVVTKEVEETVRDVAAKVDDQFDNALTAVENVGPVSSCLPAWLWISSLLKRRHPVPAKSAVLSSTAPSQ
jgi:hypothetical protein